MRQKPDQNISLKSFLNFQDGEMLEVERMVDGGDNGISCIDSEGNVVVATVYKREEMAEKESEQHREEENEFERKEKEKEDIEEDEEKEVWVAEGEPRRENLVLPGGREATALYQVLPILFIHIS